MSGQGGQDVRGMKSAGQAGLAQDQGQGGLHPPQGGQAGVGHGQGLPQYPPQQGMPYWPGHGYAMPGMQGYQPGMGQMTGQHVGQQAGQGHGMTQAMQEIANGGGLSSLTKLLDFDDKDFWKGALVGAAAVLLLTNENVQRALFRGAVKGRDAVEDGVGKVREGVDKVKAKVRAGKEKGDE